MQFQWEVYQDILTLQQPTCSCIKSIVFGGWLYHKGRSVCVLGLTLLYYYLEYQYTQQTKLITIFTMETPLNPKELFKSLLYTSFEKEECIEQENNANYQAKSKKLDLKKEVNNLVKIKIQYKQLVQRKSQLKQTLKQLLNYRQSIDYDHKYKMLKYDHYQFPYKNNYTIKQQLNRHRLQNMQKRKKINQLQQELNRKQNILDNSKTQKQDFIVSQIAHIPTKDDLTNRQQKYWLNKIDNMKSKYLNQSQQYRRAKIRHDYNLFAQKQGCRCVGMKVCPLCSDLNLQTKRNMYTNEALLSPRYNTLYKRK